MGTTKFDKLFNEMLGGKVFEGKDALEYLQRNFIDDELGLLPKLDLINLFTKAFVLICIQEQEIQGALREKKHLYLTAIEQLEIIIKHYEIYPGLIEVGKSDAQFEIVKMKAELEKVASAAFSKFIKKLPKIRKKSHLEAASAGGSIRAKNNPAHRAMSLIQDSYLESWNSGNRFPRGRLKEFYQQHADKHNVEYDSVKNAIEKLRRKLKHTNKKSNPTS